MYKGKHYSGRGRSVRMKIAIWVLLCAALAACCLIYAKGFQPHPTDETDTPVQGTDAAADGEKDEPSSAPEDTPPSGQLPEEKPPEEPHLPEDDLPPQTQEYDYSSPVPQSDSVGMEWFDDAAFIGNSRSEGIRLYKIIPQADVFADRGLMIDTVLTKPVIKTEAGKVTVIDALKEKQYGKVYIMLGTNELGWPYVDVFAEKYAEMVRAVREAQPDAQIYIQSILPVSTEKSQKDKIYNNEKITQFNEAIRGVAEREQVYYVDVQSALRDEDGGLPKDASTDGVHMNKEYYGVWLEYIRTHTVSETETEQE